MQATPPNIPAQALQLMTSKGYGYIFNGAWIFAERGQSERLDSSADELPAAIRAPAIA